MKRVLQKPLRRLLIGGVAVVTMLAVAPAIQALGAGSLTATFAAASDWGTGHEGKVTVTNGTATTSSDLGLPSQRGRTGAPIRLGGNGTHSRRSDGKWRELQETASWLPSDRMLVETDSPFLAPVPHRGQTCEPAFVADTARFVAELRNEPPEALAETTTANFFRLFSRASA